MIVTQHPTAGMALEERVFMVLASIFIASLILTNIIAGKYFTFLGLPLSCSTLVYPFTFVVTDIVSEVYGIYRARLLVLAGFIVSIVVTMLVWIANQLPIAPTSPIDATTFSQLFGLFPGVVLGSMIGYLTAQFIDVQIFEYLRTITKNKHLWLRNNLSTLTSQLIDTVIVVTIAWVIWPMIDGSSVTQPIGWQVWTKIVVGQYLFKGLLALLDTPIVYISTYLIEKWIGIQRS
ncbi:MAG: queuosine precursor transporter [Candidatus Amoebophilus sp.]